MMVRYLLASLLLVACGGPDDPVPATSTPVGSSAATATTGDTGTPSTAPVVPLSGPGDMRRWADPFVGTGGVGAEVVGATPAASWPLGLTLVGPDTRHTVLGAPSFYHFGGYHHDDDAIAGFSFTHSHAMGINEFGAVHVMVRDGFDPAFTDPEGRMLPFGHEEESASPGVYEVHLGGDGIDVSIVATEHGAHQRFTFGAGAEPVVLLDLGHGIGTVEVMEAWAEADPSTGELWGFQRLDGGYSGRFGGLLNHFSLQFDPAPVAVGGWTDPLDPVDGVTRVEGTTSGIWLTFPAGTTTVDLRGALSYVDLDGARANRAAEMPDLDHEARRAEVEGVWDAHLDRVALRGGTDEERRIFATALYHTLLMPSRQDDVDGRYRGLDGEVHTTDHRMLSDMSLWDTFRTVHPWYLLVWPDVQRDVLRSLEAMVRDGGDLPRWPMAHGYTGGMVGTPAAQVLAGSWAKGLRDGWDADALLDATIATSTGPAANAGRAAVDSYTTLGWVPSDLSGGSASRTLEYAWSDHATAAWAEAMGRDGSQLAALSDNWRNVWDAEAGYFRGRASDGTFEPWDDEPFAWTDEFVEGNALHYRWYVPYDVAGMIEVQHGGDTEAFLTTFDAYWDAVADENDDVLPDDWYWHGNEPVMHYAALASLAGDPVRSTRAFDWVSTHRYDLSPSGLDGNDDAGTLSAWYLWASMGVYPVAGTDRYALTAPRFQEVRIARDGSADLVITAPGTPTTWGGVTVDGTPVEGGGLTHEQLLRGLVFLPTE